MRNRYLSLRAYALVRSQRGALGLVQAAFTLPIIISVVFGAYWIYTYIRTFTVLGHIAQRAADIASSNRFSLDQIVPGDNTPYRSYLLARHWDQCLSAASPSDCFDAAIGEERTAAIARINSDVSMFNSKIADTSEQFPFALFEKATAVPGYFPVQTLPLIGIERGCFETFNESGASINTITRLYNAPDSNLVDDCRHVKPMYWQSPVKADFDGDRKEDLVFFKPNGSDSTTWGDRAASSESDFIIFYSGWGFSGAVGGHGYFNLTTARGDGSMNPQAIPVVADYDRDGISDYAVYEPATATFRIALSSAANRLIIEGQVDADFADLLGEKGIIAIPGNWRNSISTDIAVIRTAGEAAKRYNIQLTDLAEEIDKILTNESAYPRETITSESAAAAESITAASLKPHRGLVAVPAPGDYDDDGVTELGYLNFSGGNMAKLVGGEVNFPNNAVAEGSSLFESGDSPGAALSTRMNPFDMHFDSSGNLYYLDSVDSRIWKISAPDTMGLFEAQSVEAVMPTHATQAAPTGTPVSDFPLHNVLNVPISAALSGSADEGSGSAGSKNLRHPRKFVIGPDNVMYIADFGNSRIIRVEPSGGTLSSGNTAKVILGSKNCVAGGCTDEGHPSLEDYLAGGLSAVIDDLHGDAGGVEFYPMALAIVPDSTYADKYSLAFSSGSRVYLLTPDDTVGGPTGDLNDFVTVIAGISGTAMPTGSGDSERLLGAEIISPLSSNAPRDVGICPVTDIQYKALGDGVLYLASSCSAVTEVGVNFDSSANNIGGILKLSANNTGNFDANTTLSVLAGGFLTKPCVDANAKCAGPSSSGAPGIYQRSVNLTAADSSTIQNMDLINPVDLEVGPGNSLYFINQWNADVESDSSKYPNGPQRTDYQHQQGIYRLELDSDGDAIDVSAVTNPLQFGSDTIPVESAFWRSPYMEDETFKQYIGTSEAPAKNFPLPAVAALALDPNGERLYVSTPFLRNVHAADHPYYVDPFNVGFIYRVDLDQDGDGVFDGSDSDIDGDGRPSDTQSYCANPLDMSNAYQSCRTQEKSGNPFQSFFKLNGGNLNLEINSGPANKSYGEFYLVNSVSECGGTECTTQDETGAGAIARPEVWATLLNYGDDQDHTWSANTACPAGLEALDPGNPSVNCAVTSNGPIAAPLPIHALTGSNLVFDPDLEVAGFYAETAVGDQIIDHRMLYPTVLSSTMPRENGIKPTRNAPTPDAGGSGQPIIRDNGVLCSGYRIPSYSGGSLGTATAPANSFSFSTASYLSSQATTAISTSDETGGSADNDALNYVATCAASGSGDSIGAVEGVVLQLNHDEDTNKRSGAGSNFFPPGAIAGSEGQGENTRQFLMLDLDGDGTRNPGFLTTDSLWSSNPAFADDGPFTYIAMGLRGTDSRFSQIRAPWAGQNLLNTLGIVDYSFNAAAFSGTLKPSYFAHTTAVSDLNSSFDYTKQDNNSLETVAIGLDFEPLVTRGFAHSAQKDIGAAMYAQNFDSSRLKNTANTPALIAAKNLLKLSLGVDPAQVTLDGASYDSNPNLSALVTLVNSQTGAACDGEASCDAVKISRRIDIFGRSVELTRYGFINSTATNNDPN